jgi:hypothetical protein
MDAESLNQRLSDISPKWTLLFQAFQGSADTVTTAQGQLLQRYSGAVFRYFLGAVHDPEVAAELSQEFALRFLRGDFRGADPQRGRFAGQPWKSEWQRLPKRLTPLQRSEHRPVHS